MSMQLTIVLPTLIESDATVSALNTFELTNLLGTTVPLDYYSTLAHTTVLNKMNPTNA